MKKLRFILVCFILCAFSQDFTSAQEYNLDNTACGTDGVPGGDSEDGFRGGYYKTHRSDIDGDPSDDRYFPILIVFVQFYTDPVDQSNGFWPAGSPPTYMSSMITNQRQSGSNWWNLYNGYDVSDYWHEFSRGKLHALGKAYSVILPQTEAWYRQQSSPQDPDKDARLINKDIYEKLKLQITTGTEWQFYDKWTNSAPGTTSGNFSWGSDGKLDMMYVVFRTSQTGTLHVANAEGWVPLFGAENEVFGQGYPVYTEGSYTLYVDGIHSEDGSGLVVNGRGSPCSRELFLEVMSHEHGHYLFGSGHLTCSKMAKGSGREFSLSPWEMIKLDYILPKTVNYSSPVHYLGDYSSRGGGAGTTGEILQIPINSIGNGEFFLIANRRKISQWDRRMSGDTLADAPFNFLSTMNPEYGKGLYIYHIRNGFEYQNFDYSNSDMECADGLWNWEQSGYATPIWYQGSNLLHPTFKRVSPSYDNDDINRTTTCNNRDAMSLSCNATSLHPVLGWITSPSQTWYSIGKAHQYTNPPTSGTDRLYTNNEDYWYSLEFYGDRWDAWNVGYNEIFSPWSSPNTKDQATPNAQTGIYIWYKALNTSTNEATIEVYKVGENGETENSILQKTPPSRPMGLKVEEQVSGKVCHPKLTWNHNMEPDMLTIPGGEGIEYYKRYKIFRATYLSMYGVPGTFTEIADIYTDPGTTPSYIDDEINMYYCSAGEDSQELDPYPVRYKIKAVDDYDDESVFSDFAQTIGAIESGGPIDPDRPTGLESDTPKEFSLKQNYPNPFNPSTNIQFDLPKEGFVSIKIYDMLGREVATLVNEFRNAGSYIVGFNGSNLSSGVYYYKIKAGTFEATKRMVLIK